MSIYEQEWPSLVDESRDLLVVSILMYGVTRLRSLARQGKLKEGDADRILTLPFSLTDVLDVVGGNKEVVKSNVGQHDYEMYGSAVLSLEKDILDGQNEARTVAFDDEHSEDQLVYAIITNDNKKRVIVAFRGSSTPRDFMVDADGDFCDLINPLKPDSKETIGVHHGFYEYLNGVPKSRTKAHGKAEEDNVQTVNKYTEIMTELTVVFKGCPGYKLYCCGHSLGASLAILFALQAAASTIYSVPKPVTCISFASPKVGDINFRTCFHSLEVQGKIRSLRFVNSGDIIPTLPDRQNFSFCRNIRCKPSVYRHCGPKIILRPDGEYEVAYEKDDPQTLWKSIRDVRYTFGHGLGFVMTIPALIRFKDFFLTNHGCDTYLRRFNGEFAKTDLRLNDIYKREVAKLTQKMGGSTKGEERKAKGERGEEDEPKTDDAGGQVSMLEN